MRELKKLTSFFTCTKMGFYLLRTFSSLFASTREVASDYRILWQMPLFLQISLRYKHCPVTSKLSSVKRIFFWVEILEIFHFFFSSTKMAPNVSLPTGVLHECDDEVSTHVIAEEFEKPSDRKLQLVWRNIILFIYLHIVAVYGFYLCFTSAKWLTVFHCK